MKKWLLGLFLVACFPAYAEQYPIADFHCGLNSNYSPLTIQDCEVQDTLNTLFDEDNAVVKRKGYTVSTSTFATSFYGGWAYTDAAVNNWRVYLTSNTIIATNGNGTFSVKIATYTAGTTVNATTAFNKIWFVDQQQGVYNWDGTTMLNIAGSPKGKYIAAYKNRLVVSGLVSPNQSQVYISKYLDGTTWATGSLATDPVILTAGLQDASDIVTAFYSGFNDILLIFKKQSIYALFGTDQVDFSMKVLNTEVGCIDQRSIQPYQNGIVFVSGRAIEYYNGATVIPISDKIKNYLTLILDASFNLNTWGQSSQGNFETGISSPSGYLSFSTIPGAVVLSTRVAYSTTQTTAADWNTGTLVRLSSTSINGSLILSIATPTVQIQNLTTGSTEFVTGWTEDGTHSCDVIGSPIIYSQYFAQSFKSDSLANKIIAVKVYLGEADWNNPVWSVGAVPCNGPACQQRSGDTLRIKSDSSGFPGSDLATASIADTDIVEAGGWVSKSFNLSISPSTTYWIYLDGSASSFCSGGDNGVRANRWFGATSNQYILGKSTGQVTVMGTGDDFAFEVDFSTVYYSSGSYTSPIFDVGTDTNTWLWNWGNFTANSTLQTGTTISYMMSVSTALANVWDTTTTITSGSKIPLATKRYAVYIASFSTTNFSTTPVLNDISFGTSVMSKSSGTYLSAVNNITSINTWDLFTVTKQDNNDNQTFYLRSSTNPFSISSSTPAWVGQTVNAIITASTGTYFQMRDDFIITNATYTPTLYDFSINWYSGNQPISMVSTAFEQRYYLASSTSAALGYNNIVFVLGKNFSNGPVWSIWDLRAGAFVVQNGRMYHASGNAIGKEYQDFMGYMDVDNPITTFIKTKDYALGDFTIDKYFNSLFLYAENMGHFTLDTSYYINKTDTGYNLDQVYQDESGGILNLRLPFPYSDSMPRFGKTISFKFINSAANEQIKLLGGVLDYTPAKHIR
jgi:hypothetical protein